MNKNMRNAVYAVAAGDALGCPVQFESRETVGTHPVTGMRGYGTFNLPEGSWTDDTSLTLCAADSIRELNRIDAEDIMKRFCAWMYDGEYTPFGFSYDIGRGTMNAINAYNRERDIHTCGGTSPRNNGNGSLMRISPVCVFAAENTSDDEEMISLIDEVSALTHGHARAKTACGLYGFMVRAIIRENGTLPERLQSGIDQGFAYYTEKGEAELNTYARLRDLHAFAGTDVHEIHSSGYVVDALEAAVWSLITENSLEDSLLKAVNLGEDTDTTAAIAGGLAGLYYGMDAIPADWLASLKNKDLIDRILL